MAGLHGRLDFYSLNTEQLAARRTFYHEKAKALTGGVKSDAELTDETKEQIKGLISTIKLMDKELANRADDVESLLRHHRSDGR